MNVLIIGAGNMGLTYGKSFIASNSLKKSNIFVLERRAEKAEEIKVISANPLFTEVGDFVEAMDMLILSVKPQDFQRLADKMKPFLSDQQLVLSIMAGIRLQSLSDTLGASKIVRAMPNLPSQVGEGMTVFTATDAVTRKEVLEVQNLLSTTGKTLYADEEALLDAATAISGSGPAYVYFFMQTMIEAAQKMGFNESEANLLVEQTFRGSLDLLHHNNLSCEDWIKRVSSKGGTTEAAMNSYQQASVKALIDQGVYAALKRSKALSEEAISTLSKGASPSNT